MGLCRIRTNLHHGSATRTTEYGRACRTSNSAVLKGCLKELTVDHAVQVIVVKHSRLRLRALLNSVERGALARDVNVRLGLLHALGVACAVGRWRVVLRLVSLRDGVHRDGPSQVALTVGLVSIASSGNRGSDASGQRRPPPALLICRRTLNDRIDVAGRERPRNGVPRSHQVRWRNVHQRVEGVRHWEVGNGTVQTSVLVGNVSRLSAETNLMLRRSKGLEGHAASAVVLVVRRDERWGWRVLHVSGHGAVTLVHLREWDAVAVVLQGSAELALSALHDGGLHRWWH